MSLPASDLLSSSGSYCIKKETYSIFYFLAVLHLVLEAELMSPGHTGKLTMKLQTVELVTQSDSIISDQTTNKRICQILELREIQWSRSERVGGLLRRARE